MIKAVKLKNCFPYQETELSDCKKSILFSDLMVVENQQ